MILKGQKRFLKQSLADSLLDSNLAVFSSGPQNMYPGIVRQDYKKMYTIKDELSLIYAKVNSASLEHPEDDDFERSLYSAR